MLTSSSSNRHQTYIRQQCDGYSQSHILDHRSIVKIFYDSRRLEQCYWIGMWGLCRKWQLQYFNFRQPFHWARAWSLGALPLPVHSLSYAVDVVQCCDLDANFLFWKRGDDYRCQSPQRNDDGHCTDQLPDRLSHGHRQLSKTLHCLAAVCKYRTLSREF